MLRFLRIRNLAVIESVEVEFERGFNVLTGETGAGKSILIEAVGLLLGGRASGDLVRTGEAVATIEAIFETDGQGTPRGGPSLGAEAHLSTAAGPPTDESGDGQELIVRREISNQGRSRSFINGALATAAALRDLSQRLVELHGQHEHQALLDPATHLPLLDGFAQLEDEAARVAAAWSTVRALREQLDRSRMDAREKAARLELIAFQLSEIDKAALQPGEDDELTATRQVLASAERVQRLCQESYASLYESDDAILASLGGVWKRVGELASIDPQFTSYVEARDGIKSQLEDLAFFLRSYGDGIDASPARLQQVEDRLVLLERLKRKYGPSLQEVIDHAGALRRERDLLTGDAAGADDLQRSLDEAIARFLGMARDLSQKRRRAAGPLAQSLEALLAELAMPRTRFEVRFNERELAEDGWSDRGIDQAEFFVSPNPGEELRPLARIVSGGELSRVMLALKTLAVKKPGLISRGMSREQLTPPSLIFDEVDAGIGGRVADVVGARLRELGDEFQVLCITHLPQIAARATTQFRIEKTVRGNRTVTSVERLDEEGRVDEIARMIGGASITDRVRESARELLDGGSASPAPSLGGTRPTRVESEGKSERRKRK